jgi:hypothetical protein
MKKVRIGLIIVVIGIVAVEIFLRNFYGFCDTVLTQEDPDYEYIAQPSQNRYRFRHHVSYNSLSMRSEEVDTSASIILGFGDSVINGGVQTEQDSLATTILSEELSETAGRKVQFLNISTGSWGPDNCFAYVKKHGNFGAQNMYLFVSSHDAYDNMNFEKIVGVNESFPSKQYKSAIAELLIRYLLPRLGIFQGGSDGLGIDKKNESSTFNPGFDSILSYSKENNIPLTLYLHAELSELEAKSYNDQGQEIIHFAEANNIRLIKDLDLGLQSSEFRDDIHINSLGQRKLAARVLKNLEE